tara:strand:+ start:288 stop:1859 length:1572 start_codon:yes stop_codon:yes gene_type:complete
MKYFIYSLVYLLFCLPIKADVATYQKNQLYGFKSLQLEINRLSTLISRCEKHQNKISSNSNKLDLDQLETLVNDLDVITEMIELFQSDSPLAIPIKFEIKLNQINQTLFLKHQGLFSDYFSFEIDESFLLNKNVILGPAHVYNPDGFWVNADNNNNHLHATRNYKYWYPIGTKGRIKDPQNPDKTISSFLCGDATKKFPESYAQYISTKNQKNRLKNAVVNFQKEEIYNALKIFYLNQTNLISPAMSYFNNVLKNKKNDFSLIVEDMKECGVIIPASRLNDYRFIYSAAELHGKQIYDYYENYIELKKSKDYLNAAYNIFALITIDKNNTHESALKEATAFRKKFTKKIQRQFMDEIKLLEKGKYSNIAIEPLSQAQIFILVGLKDLELLSNYKPARTDFYTLPNILIDMDAFQSVLAYNNISLMSISELTDLTKVDHLKIESTYLKQIGNTDLKRNNIDYNGFSGLFSGKYILTSNQNGKIKVKGINLNFTESWGVKNYSLTINNPDAGSVYNSVNIRIVNE